MQRIGIFVLAMVSVLVVGCGGPAPTAETNPTAKPKIEMPVEKPKGDLATLKKEADAARDAFTKNPKDADLKKAAIDKIFAEAEFAMYEADLPPREKYTLALKLYREVVKMDPEHKEAQTAITTIVDIYKSMGRPVPG